MAGSVFNVANPCLKLDLASIFGKVFGFSQLLACECARALEAWHVWRHEGDEVHVAL
jgi:hypothetical protein